MSSYGDYRNRSIHLHSASQAAASQPSSGTETNKKKNLLQKVATSAKNSLQDSAEKVRGGLSSTKENLEHRVVEPLALSARNAGVLVDFALETITHSPRGRPREAPAREVSPEPEELISEMESESPPPRERRAISLLLQELNHISEKITQEADLSSEESRPIVDSFRKRSSTSPE